MARMAVKASCTRPFRWSTAVCWRSYSGPTLVTIQARIAARMGVVIRKTMVSLALSKNAMPSPMNSMTGLRTKGRRPVATALSMTVTSVVMRVTRDGVEKWSRLAKSNCCSLRYSASRRAAAKPLAARAANLAYSRPVIRASTAQMIILLPCSIMTCISWLGTPWSTRSDISIGMTISKIHSTKTSPTARNKSRR